MRTIVEILFRLLAFVGKELAETVRRPGAIVSLVLGPFLIMGLFGVGYSGVKRRPAGCPPTRPATRSSPAAASTSSRSPPTGRPPTGAWRTAAPTSSSSPPTIRRRASGPGSSR
jgi:hypothetical protein